jgi:Fe2+ transport system protein FeoA
VHDLIPLNLLERGRRAEVAEVVGSLDQVQRMRELGLCQGAELEVVQPGSPCIVRFGANKLCIRAADVLGVLVRGGVAT